MLFRFIMTEHAATDSLGERIISAARLAVAAHLEMDRRESLQRPSKTQAMIGGTDRRVTDDPMSIAAERD